MVIILGNLAMLFVVSVIIASVILALILIIMILKERERADNFFIAVVYKRTRPFQVYKYIRIYIRLFLPSLFPRIGLSLPGFTYSSELLL